MIRSLICRWRGHRLTAWQPCWGVLRMRHCSFCLLHQTEWDTENHGK
jgi:hypothetical protein